MTTIAEKLQILREVARDFMNRDGLRQMRVLELIDELDEQIAREVKEAWSDAEPNLTDEQILQLARHHAIDHEHWSENRLLAFARALLSASKPVATVRDRARWFVRDFSRDVGFAMSAAQTEVMLNLFLRYAAPQPSPTAVVLDDERAAFREFHASLNRLSANTSVSMEDRVMILSNATFLLDEYARAASPQPVEQTRALTDHWIDMMAIDACVAGDSKGRLIFTRDSARAFARDVQRALLTAARPASGDHNNG